MQHLQRYWSREEKRMKYHFDELTNSELSDCIDAWVKDKRAREMLKARFLDCMTFDELSVKFHLSDRQVKRIIYKYGDYLLSKI